MKKLLNKYTLIIVLIIAALVMAYIFFSRKVWDEIMLFFNFGILVFLFIRFARKPMINFLRGEGDKISERIREIEAEVKKARSILEEESSRLEGVDDRVNSMRDKIINVGQNEKNKIIEKAKKAADKMVEDAKKEADFKMEAAKKRFSEEMLDLAVSLAVKKIKTDITSEDDENLVLSFSSGLNAEKDHFA
ncbi:ATP synthase F0 subunit B [Thermodesulfobacteriota bacterium]